MNLYWIYLKINVSTSLSSIYKKYINDMIEKISHTSQLLFYTPILALESKHQKLVLDMKKAKFN
jgi:hypothetical protein